MKTINVPPRLLKMKKEVIVSVVVLILMSRPAYHPAKIGPFNSKASITVSKSSANLLDSYAS